MQHTSDQTQPALGMSVTLKTGFADAEARVTAALKAEGFGVLTEIDVKATLKAKIDVDFRPYKILGACNPHLAYRALSSAPEVGLLLPCNVTLAQVDADHVEVSIIDPVMMMGVAAHPDLQPVADDARARLVRVVESLKE
ncbi:MAG TPA: DUF302 domain-containing protein [Aggregatilineales bacterium]|nr:DUF302 domain-containing protein [Aggregatilineales bacterium]